MSENKNHFGKCLKDIPFNKLYKGMRVGFEYKEIRLTGTILALKNGPMLPIPLGCNCSSVNQIGIDIDDGPLTGVFHNDDGHSHFLNNAQNWYFLEENSAK